MNNYAEFSVHVMPDDLTASVPASTPLVAAILQAGIAVDIPCGGFGLCGKCKARITEGTPQPTSREVEHLSPDELQDGWRLLCRHALKRDTQIHITESIRSRPSPILTQSAGRECDLAPAVRILHVTVPAPTTSDERSDVARLIDAVGSTHGVHISPSGLPVKIVRSLPSALRDAGFDVSVLLYEGGNHAGPCEVLAVESTSLTAQQPVLGMAFDIGTTTLVGYLVDLETGHELACASRLNPQIPMGDDVVSRLSTATQQEDGLKSLQRSVLKGINEIVDECVANSGTEPSRIFEVVVAGNTTMLHLLLGVDPAPISLAPYVPVFSSAITMDARPLGIHIHPHGKVTALPCPAGYVGADTVGVVLTHLCDPDGPTALAIDIGTNGEVVLRHEGKFYCTSAAAGPAFEGGRIFQGMRAASGAISEVALCSEAGRRWLRVTTIDEAPPSGICGSGLIDAIAALLDAGVIDSAGRMSLDTTPNEWRERIVTVNDQKSFQLSAGAEAVVLTQRDIREFQMAKGSLSAVTEVLLATAGVGWDDVSSVYVAGAFGMFVNLRSAQRIGLLTSVPLERILTVGNAAGAGAKLSLCSVVQRDIASELAYRMRHVPMTTNLTYEDALIEQIGFPKVPGECA